MVGGNEESFNLALPILNNMGKKVVHAGDLGSGLAAKICNNMILGISMIALSESFTMAKKTRFRSK
jgi:3-hydroxyisobutyrate dehydrogenase